MNIEITGTRMASADTSHYAQRISARDDTWRLSWLPDRLLSRNEAITGMVLAATLPAALSEDSQGAARMRAHARDWAAELGLTTEQAHVLITKGPATR